MPKYDEASEFRMWAAQVTKKFVPKVDRAVRKYSDEIKRDTGHRIRVTYGMVLEKAIDLYLNGDKNE